MCGNPSPGAGGTVRVALTGGIACGKSEAMRILREEGVAVLDADGIAHELMRPGEEVFDAVVQRFGTGILAGDGTIDRRELGERVFADPEQREVLNGLVHPAVRRRWRAWLEERRAAGEPAVVGIPLLFEAGAGSGWTAIVCVAASGDRVMERLRRRGYTDRQARQRIAAQWPLDEKRKRSDYVIENNGTLDELRARVVDTWHRIIGKE